MKGLPILLLGMLTISTMGQSKKFLALGDSYTIGESVSEQERWPVQLMTELNKRGFKFDTPRIIATTGWRTDDLKNAILQANLSNDFDLVSLLIGVNNQYQGKSAKDYGPQFEELLKMAISFAGGDKTKVFVVSIPDYGYTPFGKEKQSQISKDLDEFNRINRSITQKYNIAYFNITDISRRGFQEPALVAKDSLHPSGMQYKQWVDLILKELSVK